MNREKSDFFQRGQGMKANLVIDLSGEAFGHDDRSRASELMGVLLDVCSKLNQADYVAVGVMKLYDSNGLPCGTFRVSDEK